LKTSSSSATSAFTSCLLVLATVGAIGVPQASAQTDAAGGGTSGRGHGLEVSGSVVEAYDGDVPLEVAALASSFGEAQGYSTMFLGNLDYDWQSPRVQVGANGASALRHYQELGEFRSVSHTAGFGLSSRLGQRSTLSLNQTAAYSPSYLYSLFPSVSPVDLGDAPVGAPDYATSDTVSYIYGTAATISHGLSRRGNLSATGELQHTDFQQSDTRQDVTAYTFRGTYLHSVARNTSFSATYRFRTGDLVYGTDDVTELPTPEWQKTTGYGVEIGVAHNRPLSASRRVFLNMGFGSSKLDAAERAPGDEGFGYRLSGQAEFGYQFARTWQVRAGYRRGVEFVPDLSEPAFLDGVTASIEGGLSRSIGVTGLVSYSSGESAFTSSGYLFDTYTGNVRLNWRVTDAFAMYGEYLYYYYDFGKSALLTPGVPSVAERSGARLGITLRLRPIRG
jgi:hypothetical protein